MTYLSAAVVATGQHMYMSYSTQCHCLPAPSYTMHGMVSLYQFRPFAHPQQSDQCITRLLLNKSYLLLCSALFPEWYFQIALEKSWIGWHTYYCKVAVKASKVDASKTARIIDCSETSVPYSSPFTLLTQDGDQVGEVGIAAHGTCYARLRLNAYLLVKLLAGPQSESGCTPHW